MSGQLQRMIDLRTPAGWSIELNSFGIYEASHDDFDASYEGPEDGWVGNGLACTGNSLDEVLCGIQEIEEEHPYFADALADARGEA